MKQAQIKLPADSTIQSSTISTLTWVLRLKYSLQHLFHSAFSKVQFLAGVMLTFQSKRLSITELAVFAP